MCTLEIEQGRKNSNDLRELPAEFLSFLIQALLNQNIFRDTETEFYIRRNEDLDDFLYSSESSFTKKDSARRFDCLDFILIEGDANIRPWSKSFSKVLILLRMALETRKRIFLGSAGMQALTFLCSTDFEKVF